MYIRMSHTVAGENTLASMVPAPPMKQDDLDFPSVELAAVCNSLTIPLSLSEPLMSTSTPASGLASFSCTRLATSAAAGEDWLISQNHFMKKKYTHFDGLWHAPKATNFFLQTAKICKFCVNFHQHKSLYQDTISTSAYFHCFQAKFGLLHVLQDVYIESSTVCLIGTVYGGSLAVAASLPGLPRLLIAASNLIRLETEGM